MIYAMVRNQVVENKGIREVDGKLLIDLMSLYEIENQTDCFERVLAASRTILNA